MKKLCSFGVSIVIALTLSGVILLRFYSLGSLPPGTNLDEINIGVESTSIFQSGKDSWGESFPRVFRGFGEYKAPGLIYATAAILKFVSLTPFATRLPSAVSGLLSAYALYLIISNLIPKMSKRYIVALMALYLISPWTFGISRQFYEANVGLPFILFGIYFLLRNNKTSDLIWSGVFLGISGYFYMTFRYLSIIFILIYGLFYKSNYFTKLKVTSILLAVTLIVGIGWSIDYLSQKSLRRLSQFNDYTTFGNGLIVNENREFCYLVSGKNMTKSKPCYIFWNKPTVQISRTFNTYLTSISPTSLFIDANNDFTVPKNFGMYIWVLFPFYIFGLMVIIQSWAIRNESHASIRLYSLWLLLAPIPQMLTTEVTIHRNVIFLALSFVVIVLGIDYFYKTFLAKTKIRIIFTIFLSLVMLLYSAQYLSNYFSVYTHSDELKWNADKKEIWDFLKSYNLNTYRIVDTKYLGPMDAAFYGFISPAQVQQGIHGTPNAGGWSHLVSAGNVETGNVSMIDDLLCQKHINKSNLNTIFITDPSSEFGDFAVFTTKSFTGVFTLHQVLDLDMLYSGLVEKSPARFKGCK